MHDVIASGHTPRSLCDDYFSTVSSLKQRPVTSLVGKESSDVGAVLRIISILKLLVACLHLRQPKPSLKPANVPYSGRSIPTVENSTPRLIPEWMPEFILHSGQAPGRDCPWEWSLSPWILACCKLESNGEVFICFHLHQNLSGWSSIPVC